MLYTYKYKIITSCQTMLGWDGESCVTLLHKVKYLFGVFPVSTDCLYTNIGITKDNIEEAIQIANKDMCENDIDGVIKFEDVIRNVYNKEGA